MLLLQKPQSPVLRDNSSSVEVFHVSNEVGHGLRVAENSSINSMDIVTEYPGTRTWLSASRSRNTSTSSVYVYQIGPFSIPNMASKYYIFIDAAPYIHDHGYRPNLKSCAHIANTSHPQIVAPGNYPNCVWALYAHNLELDIAKSPDVKLYIMAMNSLGPGTELLLDYHWQLAYDRGFWCLDRRCEHCIDGLLHFCYSLRNKRKKTKKIY